MPSDYLIEAPGWNLSPIMFQPGVFCARARHAHGLRGTELATKAAWARGVLTAG